MKYAIIDTETSGLFDFSKPADAEGQPRLASLAVIEVDGEELIKKTSFLVKPDGWEMSAEAGAVNGLTTEQLKRDGVPVNEVLENYVALIDEGFVIVAYNAQFDTKVMRGELRRAGIPDRFEQTKNICLMRASTDMCQVPKKNGKGFKFPKLEEACKFFGIKQADQHSASGDASAAFEIMLKLQALEKLPEPQVYFAANRPEQPKE